jgi:hypothetical protein
LENLLEGLTGGSTSPRYDDSKPNIRSDFELSLKGVHFRIGGFFYGNTDISVVKTAKGIIATYVEAGTSRLIREFSEAKLDTAEWQNFVNVLHKCIGEWRKEYNSGALDGTQWSLNILFSDKEGNIEFFGSNALWVLLMLICQDLGVYTTSI